MLEGDNRHFASDGAGLDLKIGREPQACFI
jgi:hypothetical protein